MKVSNNLFFPLALFLLLSLYGVNGANNQKRGSARTFQSLPPDLDAPAIASHEPPLPTHPLNQLPFLNQQQQGKNNPLFLVDKKKFQFHGNWNAFTPKKRVRKEEEKKEENEPEQSNETLPQRQSKRTSEEKIKQIEVEKEKLKVEEAVIEEEIEIAEE
eukprot:CAMPEP_0201513276 /NCGR_PEP_ID=MMETSP0161_2-20130828/5359_1 /ASSEMBLY_ACC=CAM_ASM_000251 /TAXON_ID=180227 /ORGANISM="Neoparamoeba aestuarina, Strain SoJaBio B1-5/56/2" /LENGTH=158 /DNA_ID=CAMNT_0047909417 /DNA_START=106 /DNA_END=582 /DNA_ORIENTATION=-